MAEFKNKINTFWKENFFMFEMPDNLIEFFFEEINKNGKYIVEIKDNGAIIKSRVEQEYYKPVIIVKDLEELHYSLKHYIESLNEFCQSNNYLEYYHDLSYMLNSLLFNMTTSDALDLAQYINRRSYFFSNEQFSEFDESQLIHSFEGINFYVQRVMQDPGLETIYVLNFTMEIDGEIHKLPIVRYAFDENETCYLFALQFGRDREGSFENPNYKKVINRVNTGISNYRNVSPSFVLTYTLFLKMLQERNITKIMIPDFLFSRYRKYYRAQSEIKSDLILERILNNFIRLNQRMEVQIDGFEIFCYPNEIDSYTHINLGKISSKNNMLSRILKKNNLQ